MAKKPKREASNKQFADQVAESANQIWLAGLAAFDKAQKEGWKLFESLVEDGEKVEAKTRKLAEERIEAVKRNASGTWDKLEQVFEDRVGRALASMGVPTRADIAELSRRLDELGRAVSALAEAKPEKAAKRSKRPTPDPAAPPNMEDDLTNIHGIGPAIERKLKAAGVTRFSQIASWSDADAAEIEAKVIRRSGRVAREDWIAQAKRLEAEAQNRG